MKTTLGMKNIIAKKYDLTINDIYLLLVLKKIYDREVLEESELYPGYFRFDLAKVQHQTIPIVFKNKKSFLISLYTLKDSFIDLHITTSPPTKTKNYYIKFNMKLLQQSFCKKKKKQLQKQHPPITEKYTDEFIKQYEQICAIYDFKHKLNVNRPSRLLITAQKYIQSILDKTFLTSLPFKKEWLEKQSTDILTEDVSFDTILYAVKKYAEARSKGSWLEHAPKISLPAFFYNPYTHKSWFIIMLQTKNASDIEQMTFKDDEYAEYMRGLFQLSNLFRVNIDKIKDNIKPMYFYMKYNYTNLKNKNTNPIMWKKLFGDHFVWQHFIDLLSEYISTFNVYMGNIKFQSGFWNNFTHWIKDKYDVNI